MLDPVMFADLVRETSLSGGTDNFTLDGAPTGSVGFAAVLSPGDQFYYSAIGVGDPSQSEVGIGTLTVDGTVARAPFGGAATEFAAGPKTLSLTVPAKWYGDVQGELGGIAALETRIGAVEAADGAQDQAVAALDGRIAAVETRGDTQDQAVAALDGRIGDAEGALSALGQRIDATDGVVSLKASLDGADFTGKVRVPAATGTMAGLNVGMGTNPLTSNSENGDIWVANSGFWFKTNDAHFQVATTGSLAAALSGKADSATTLAGYGITDGLSAAMRGAVNGVAALGGDGKVPAAQLPEFTAPFVDPVADHGAVGDGVVDDTGAINAALQAAVAGNVTQVILPAGDFRLSSAITVPSGVTLMGRGETVSRIVCDNGIANAILFDGVNSSGLASLAIMPSDVGTNRSAVMVRNAQRVRIRDVAVRGQTDASGIYAVDSDDCSIDGLFFDGSASHQGYAVYMIGCRRCSVTDSRAHRVDMGFVIVGADGDALGARTTPGAHHNVIQNCHVNGHKAHAFNINSSWGNIVSNCSAEGYNGAASHPFFQIKHGSGDNTEMNLVVGCQALGSGDGTGTGFGMQQGQNAQWIGCSATNVGRVFHLNSSDQITVIGLQANGFAEAGLWLNDSCKNCIFDGVSLQSATPTAIPVMLVGGSVSATMIDHLQIHSDHDVAISIAASCADTKFGPMCKIGSGAIVDESSTTAWPVIATTPEVDFGQTGNHIGTFLPMGMRVARASMVVSADLNGTANVMAGYVGNYGSVAAMQPVSGVRTQVVPLVLSAPDVPVRRQMQCRVESAASAGKGSFVFEGLSVR